MASKSAGADGTTTLTIDLTKVKGAMSLGLNEQLYQRQLSDALSMVAEFAREAEELSFRTSDRSELGRRGDKRRWRGERLPKHDAIFVNGKRGTGKTTFLLSLRLAISGSSAGAGEMKSDLEDVVVLDMLDPTLIDADRVFLAVVVANVLRQIRHEYHRLSEQDTQRLNECLDLLAGGLKASEFSTNAPKADGRASPQDVAEQLIRMAEDGIDLAAKFDDFVACACELLGVRCMVQPIDDVDMAGGEAWVVLEATRRYLTGPRLLPVLTGDYQQYRAMVLNRKLKDVEQLLRIGERDGSEAETARQEARLLTDQYFLKLFRPERRVELLSAREAIQGRTVEVVWEGRQRRRVEDLLDAPLSESASDCKEARSHNHLTLVPVNARVFRALLVWATSFVPRRERGAERAPFVDLLGIDDSAEREEGWSAEDLRELRFESYRPLLRHIFPRSDELGNVRKAWGLERLRFDGSLRRGDPWSRVLCDKATTAVLRDRVSRGLSECIRYMIQVLYVAALSRSVRLGDEREPNVIWRSCAERETVRETAAALASHRWDQNRDSVQEGLVRMPQTYHKEKDRKSLESQNRGCWKDWASVGAVRWLWWRKSNQLAAERVGAGWFYWEEQDLVASKMGTSAGQLRFVLYWYQSRVAVFGGTSRLLDPVAGVAGIADLIDDMDGVGAAEVRGRLKERLWARSLRAEDVNGDQKQKLLTGGREANSKEPPEDNGPDTHERDSHAEAAPLAPSDALVEKMERWLKAVRELGLGDDVYMPMALAEATEMIVTLQSGQGEELRRQSPTVGNVLAMSLLGILNAVLVSEARANLDVPLDSRNVRAYLRYDAKKSSSGGKSRTPMAAFGEFSQNLKCSGVLEENLARLEGRRLLRPMADSADSTGATDEREESRPDSMRCLPVFWSLATCPLITMVLPAPWRLRLRQVTGYELDGGGDEDWCQVSIEGHGAVDLDVMLSGFPILRQKSAGAAVKLAEAEEKCFSELHARFDQSARRSNVQS